MIGELRLALMAEEKTPESESGKLTVGDLRKMITETVQSIVGGDGEKKAETDSPKNETSGGSPTAGGIAAEVQRQVEKIRAREARQKRDEEVDGKLKELSEKVQEKTPVERSRVHRFMGWGE